VVELVEQQLLILGGSDPGGDIAPFDEDAGDLTVCPDDWLVDEVDEDLLDQPVRLPLDLGRHLVPDKGLARGINLIEQLEEALPCQLRQRLPHWLADQVAFADDAPVGVIDQGIDMVRPPQDCHVAGRLLKQCAQIRYLGLEGISGMALITH
jgi:hypothetical protein